LTGNTIVGIKDLDLLRSHVAMDEGALKFHRPAPDRDLVANWGMLSLIQYFAQARRLLWRAKRIGWSGAGTVTLVNDAARQTRAGPK
jgi:hypothetical protein